MPWLGQYILDENGEPVQATGLISWAEWCETHDHRVARDIIGNATVSTVFLGLDQNFWFARAPDYKPILWDRLREVRREADVQPRSGAACYLQSDLGGGRIREP